MAKKPLDFIDEEIGVEEIDGACEVVNHLSAVCAALKLQLDDGALEERQYTIRLYNRAARLHRSAFALREAIRARWHKQQATKVEAGANADTRARAQEEQEDLYLLLKGGESCRREH